MEVTWPVAGSWALAACSVIALLGWWWAKRERRRDELRERYIRKLDDLACAEEEWRGAMLNGTPVQVLKARRDVMKIRDELASLKKAISALCVASFLAGCASVPKEPTERVVVVGEHAQIVEPGFTVPDYPAGEERWWLCTPTGLELMVPAFRREEW